MTHYSFVTRESWASRRVVHVRPPTTGPSLFLSEHRDLCFRVQKRNIHRQYFLNNDLENQDLSQWDRRHDPGEP